MKELIKIDKEKEDEIFARINNTMGKMRYYLNNHNSICVSISGGSDSDIMLHIIATYFREFLYKIHFVFSNTGLEYKATLNHLNDLEKKYNVPIERIKGISVPKAVRENGVPFISKKFSDYFSRLQKHHFDWSTDSFENLYKKYPKCKTALSWWCNAYEEGSRFNIDKKPYLKDFILSLEKVPMISFECCHVSKKKPMQKFQKSVNADLVISGERKSEDGARSTSHKSCFSKRDGIDLYMPLFFWDDETKQYYKEIEHIKYSDCYEIYGLKRTGCVGCPYALNRKEELEIMQQYEPLLYKACMNIFGEAYSLTDDYKLFKERKRKEKKRKEVINND